MIWIVGHEDLTFQRYQYLIVECCRHTNRTSTASVTLLLEYHSDLDRFNTVMAYFFRGLKLSLYTPKEDP